MNTSCPRCGASLPMSARFCSKCGLHVSPDASFIPINPYNSLYPVERFDLLYGRQELMSQFNDLLSNFSVARLPCISLVGLTRSGKTSVLNALASADRQHLNLIGHRP